MKTAQHTKNTMKHQAQHMKDNQLREIPSEYLPLE
jgi:hypothetical protein